jgi:hypothetical protein
MNNEQHKPGIERQLAPEAIEQGAIEQLPGGEADEIARHRQ